MTDVINTRGVGGGGGAKIGHKNYVINSGGPKIGHKND